MVCALPAAARRRVYRAGGHAWFLERAWERLGAPAFHANPRDGDGEPYAFALGESTRADVRQAVVTVLEQRGVSSPAPKPPKKSA